MDSCSYHLLHAKLIPSPRRCFWIRHISGLGRLDQGNLFCFLVWQLFIRSRAAMRSLVQAHNACFFGVHVACVEKACCLLFGS